MVECSIVNMDDAKCPICGTTLLFLDISEKPEVCEGRYSCPHDHFSETKLYDGFVHSIGGKHFDAIIGDTKPEEYWKQIDDAIKQYILTHKGEIMEIWFENAV